MSHIVTIKVARLNFGYTLASSLISCTFGIFLLASIAHYIYFYNKQIDNIHAKFLQQQAQLLAQHYLCTDIHNAGFNLARSESHAITQFVSNCKAGTAHCHYTADIKPLSEVLIINSVATESSWEPSNNTILYYLKKSIIPELYNQNTYALYRDDSQHQATALIENLVDLQLKIETENAFQVIHIYLTFTNMETVHLICATRNSSAVAL